MKKFFIIAMSVSLALSVSGVAFAAESTAYTAETTLKPAKDSTISVYAEKNRFSVDQKNAISSDIVISEGTAGILKKGKTVYMAIDKISFDQVPNVESEDIKIEKVKVKDGILSFTVKSPSKKDGAVIKISNIGLYMDRTIPCGNYDLNFVAGSNMPNNAIIQNYGDNDEQGKFDVEKITAVKDYVAIYSSESENSSQYYKNIAITIGSDKMYSGTNEITLDSPAYISDKGYAMLPVRALTEALSDSATVVWDDESKTVTILMGKRMASMTLGSKNMVLNGVTVPMKAECEIREGRIFVPVRDLGYALGINDNNIIWDDNNKIATLTESNYLEEE